MAHTTQRWYQTKGLKIFIGVMVVAAAILFYNFKKYPFINKELPKAVAEKTDNVYSIQYDSISINELAGNLFIKDLHIQGDTIKQQQLLSANSTDASKMLLDIRIPSLAVSGFKTAKALLLKKLACDKVIINNPTVIAYVYDVQKGRNIKKQTEDVYRQLLGNLREIKADSIEIRNANVSVVEFSNKKLLMEALNTSIGFVNVNVDSTHNEDTSRILFAEQLRIDAGKLVVHDKQTSTVVNAVHFDSKSKQFVIGSILHDQQGIKSTLNDLFIEGFDINGPLEETHINIAKIGFKKMFVESRETGQSPGNKPKPAPGEKVLPKWLDKLKVDLLQANDVSYKQINADGKDGISLNHSTINIKSINLDSTSLTVGPAVKFFKEVDISNNLVSFKTRNNLYLYSFAGIQLNSLKKNISFKEIRIKPLAGEEEFARKAKVQTDRYDIRISNLEFKEVDFEKMLQGGLYAKSVETSNSFLKVYRDVSYPMDTTKQLDSYPNQLIFDLKFPLHINRFHAKDTYIAYKERNARSDTSGTATFEHGDIVITNITNQLKGPDEICEWNFTARVLGIVPVSANIKFSLADHKAGKFSMTGAVDSLNARVFNVLTQPMSLIRIDKGTIYKLRTSFTGNSAMAQGKLDMVFDDLKISLLKKKDDKIHKRNVTSVLANLLVKNTNRKKGGERNIDFKLKRDVHRSFFNFVWKAIFSGVLDIIK